MTDVRSPLRVFRAALFAAVGVTLAAVGHSSMSGRDIPYGALLAAFAVMGVCAWSVGHRRRGVPSIAAWLLSMQAGLHLIFAGLQTYAGPSRGGHSGSGSGMDMGAHTMGSGGSIDTGESLLHSATLGHSSAGMLAAHFLAALICALWLARGEAAFFQLLAAVDSLAFAPLRLLLTAVRLPAAPRTAQRPRPRPTRPRTAVLAHAVSRRGPPASALLLRHAPLAS